MLYLVISKQAYFEKQGDYIIPTKKTSGQMFVAWVRRKFKNLTNIVIKTHMSGIQK